jgi:hypothetical protein
VAEVPWAEESRAVTTSQIDACTYHTECAVVCVCRAYIGCIWGVSRCVRCTYGVYTCIMGAQKVHMRQ